MAEPLSGGWPEQLAALLERLRQEGFRIGVPETLRLHQLLLALVDRGVPLDTPQRLTRLLGPVLCRSASEQEAFGGLVEQWWPGPVAAEPVPAPAPATTPANNNPIATLCRIATVRCCPSARKPCQSVALSESAQTATKPMLSNHGLGMTPQPPCQIIPIHPSPILILMTITRRKLLRNKAGWRLTLSSNHMSNPAPITAATIASHA